MTIIHNTHVTFPPFTPPPEPVESLPTLSMSSECFYKTQKSTWSTHFTGLLTDRAIARYQKKKHPVKHVTPLRKPKKVDPMKALLNSLLSL